MADPLPFIEIRIIHTTDSINPPRKILQMIENRNLLSLFNKVSWKGNSENPILRLDYESKEDFIESYKNGEELMKKFLTLLQDGTLNIDELKQELHLQKAKDADWSSTIPYEQLYLILKYTTNFKTPMRRSYKFSEWFIDFFNEHMFYEEVDDGFLFFYHKRENYINSNLNQSNPIEFKKWLNSKEIDFSSEIVQTFFELIKKP